MAQTHQSRPKSGAPQRKAPAKRTAAKAQPPAVVRGASAVGRGTSAAVGGAVRSVGTGAKAVSPDVRRDGAAVLLLIGAILVAATEWFGIGSWAGTVIHAVSAGLFGMLSKLLPIALVALALRLFRAPQEGHANHRIMVGLLFLALTVDGIIHIAKDQPLPSASWDAVMAAGGLLGFLVGTPLAAVLTAGLAVFVLVLLSLLAILVIIGMPAQSQYDFKRSRLTNYVAFMDFPQWRSLKPEHLFQQVDTIIISD